MLNQLKAASAAALLSLTFSVAQAQDVDRLTGRAQISIPLGGISASDISVPVTLWHHGNAIRVAEGEGNAGLGFNVSIGGSISRVVRGLPDDYNIAGDTRLGWLYNSNAQYVQNFTPASDDNLAVCTDEAADRTTLLNMMYNKDPEPDMFYFNAPGLSGQFVFGADGLPHIVGYQDLQIAYSTGASGISQFVIKTNTGMTYTFSTGSFVTRKAEKYKSSVEPDYFLRDYNTYTNPLSFQADWQLSSIKSGATGVQALFTYQQRDEKVSADFRTRISSASVADTLYFLRDIVRGYKLTQVNLATQTNSSTYQINVNWSDDLISSIVTAEYASGSTQEFDFLYTSLYSASDNTYPRVTKSFLSEIKQQNACITLPSYSFSYVDATGDPTVPVQPPWKSNEKQDYFGFYNGASGNKNVPTIYFYSGETGARRFRVTPIPGGSPTQTLSGQNRSVDPAYVAFGALLSISYPTGGKTFFTYEPNKYFDSSTSEELYGPGVRVKSITTSGGELLYGKSTAAITTGDQAITRSFTYTQSGSTTTSGKLLSPPVFAYAVGNDIIRSVSDLGEGGEVMYTRVTEKIDGKGSIVYEFNVPGTYPQDTDGLWEATRSKIARSSCSGSTNYANGPYTFPFAPNTEFSFSRGLLSKRSELSETGVTVRERQYTYTLTGTLLTIKGLRYEPIGSAQDIHFGVYKVHTGQSNLLTSEVAKDYSEETTSEFTQVTTTYAYNNSKNMLTDVTRTNDDNSVVKTKTKFAFDYAITTPPGGDWAADAIQKLNAANRYGEVVEQIQKFTPAGGTETVTGAQLVLFKDLSGKVLPYQTKKFPQGAAFTESAVGGTQSFNYDSDYILSTTLEEYDDYGRLINQSDNNKNRAATHYGFNQGLPVATIVNAKAQEAVFEGFEFTTGRGMTYTGGSTVYPGWTGDKALQLISSGKLTSASVNTSGTSYRISCWANAAQSTTLTFTAKNGTSIGTQTLSYNPSSFNTWVYLEGTLTLTSSPANFTVEVTTNNTVTVDELVVLPSTATIASQTIKPMVGAVSQTDDRGNSVKFSYDPLGRKVNTWDSKRNLVSVNEYTYQKDQLPVLNAGISFAATAIKAGQSISFAANPVCTSVNYQWKVDGVLQSSTTSGMSKSFSYGMHSVELIATSTTYGSQSSTISVCADVPDPSPAMTVSPDNKFYFCSNDAYAAGGSIKIFTMNLNAGCTPSEATYVWSATATANGNPVPLTGATDANNQPLTSSSNTLKFTSPNLSYTVRCDVTFKCGSVDPRCAYSTGSTVFQTFNITYINDGPGCH